MIQCMHAGCTLVSLTKNEWMHQIICSDLLYVTTKKMEMQLIVLWSHAQITIGKNDTYNNHLIVIFSMLVALN